MFQNDSERHSNSIGQGDGSGVSRKRSAQALARKRYSQDPRSTVCGSLFATLPGGQENGTELVPFFNLRSIRAIAMVVPSARKIGISPPPTRQRVNVLISDWTTVVTLDEQNAQVSPTAWAIYGTDTRLIGRAEPSTALANRHWVTGPSFQTICACDAAVTVILN
jgi:hypothetical protein